MIAPIEPRVDYAQYIWVSFVALLGGVVRVGRWTDSNGKFLISTFLQEFAGALVFGQIAVSACAYMNWKMSIAGGIAGVAGLLGAVSVTGLVKGIISLRIGGKKDASDPKAS